jgi:hypothetical protein
MGYVSGWDNGVSDECSREGVFYLYANFYQMLYSVPLYYPLTLSGALGEGRV